MYSLISDRIVAMFMKYPAFCPMKESIVRLLGRSKQFVPQTLAGVFSGLFATSPGFNRTRVFDASH